jgi:hypothetical protein
MKRGKESEHEDDDVVSVSSEAQEARTEAEEAAEVAAAERQEGEHRRFDTDDEALPELPPEYRPGGALDIPYRPPKGKYAPTPAEEAKLSRWWRYRHFLNITNPALISAQYTRPELRRQAHEGGRVEGKKTGSLGGTFAGFNLNDMIYRGRLIDAGFTPNNATAALRNQRLYKVRDYLPHWPEGTPLPAEFEIALARQQHEAAKRVKRREALEAAEAAAAAEEAEAARKKANAERSAKYRANKAKAKAQSTARSSRG